MSKNLNVSREEVKFFFFKKKIMSLVKQFRVCVCLTWTKTSNKPILVTHTHNPSL